MKYWPKFLFIFLILLLFLIGKTLKNAGFFTKIHPHHQGSLRLIPGFQGTEDITIDYSKGLALISSNDFTESPNKLENGAIFLLNLNSKSPKPINLTEKLDLQDFHPHGISLYQTKDDKKFLFVINHQKAVNSVEIFQFSDSSLVHLETFIHPLLVSPNDILAVGENQFYVTNDHDEKKSSWRAKKDLLQIPMGNVCYFNNKNASIVADNLLYANGINKSKDKLFVAETSGKKIDVFDCLSDGKLEKFDEISIMGADNIETDTDGNLWVGCHPKLLAFLEHSKDHKKRSPSEIIKIEYKNRSNYSTKSIYLNDGTPVSGSSVGAFFQNQLLVGTVFEDSLLVNYLKN